MVFMVSLSLMLGFVPGRAGRIEAPIEAGLNCMIAIWEDPAKPGSKKLPF
jgi:hypothetical protein